MVLAILRRITDKASFSRKEVLRALTELTENNAIQVYQYDTLLCKCAERMKDSSQQVRKEAMILFKTILERLKEFFSPGEKTVSQLKSTADIEMMI